MALKRGDVVRVADGKPRPAVVIQSNDLPTPERILLCPLTSHLVDAPYLRPTIAPDKLNGLLVVSQLMADQIGASKLTSIDGVIGTLSIEDVARMNAALAMILSIDSVEATPEPPR